MATVRWIGAAQDVRQVSTIAVSGTWATGDTATLIVNNKSLTVTVGSSVSTSNVADILARAVNAANATENLLGDESRNFGGQEIPEFVEIEASASGATLTLRSATPGWPFTVTKSETTAGDGALGSVTEATAATGKNWLSNAANYSGGAVPSDGDTLIFDTGNASVLHALTHFRSNNIDLYVVVTNDWTGQMGLPAINATGGYPEYRQRYFQYRGGSMSFRVEPGLHGNVDVGRLWVDLQDQAGVTVLIGANRGPSTAAPTIFLAGADASTLTNLLAVERGAVIVEPDEAPTGSTKYAAFQRIALGTAGGAAADCVVTVGRNTRLHKSATITIFSGTHVFMAATKLTSDEAPTSLRGGSLEIRGEGNNFTFDVYSGAALYPIGAADTSTITLFGGSLDCRRAPANYAAIGTATVKAYAGSAIYDPAFALVIEFHAVGCKLSQLTLDLPANRFFDLSAAATP